MEVRDLARFGLSRPNAALGAGASSASSHREAPGVAGTPRLDTTDVHGYLSPDKTGHPLLGALAVLAFGAGMAGTLTVVGLLVGLTGDRLVRHGSTRPLLRRVAAVTPRLAAVAVIGAGLLLAVRGLLQAVGT